MNWVTVKKLSELSGYTERAIYCKKDKGVWIENTHWKHAPDGRILFNVSAIEAWIENKAA